MEGLVIKSTGSFITVKTPEGKIYPCRVKGTFRLKEMDITNPIAVGDHVEFEPEKNQETGLISKIKDRKNYIIRKSVKLSKQAQIIAANIDCAYVIATPVFPKTSTGFIDRFLATAEAYSIPAGVIFNKADLYDAEILDYVNGLGNMYTEIGYSVFQVSTLHSKDMDGLREMLKNKVNLFSGHSGVGKSSLINGIIPGLNLKIGEISEHHLKGKHTTTFAEMHEIPGGGYIIDTPGIREFGILDFDRFEVSHFFPEIFKISSECKFNNCLHMNESNCAVIKAVEESKISLTRYESYLSILNNEDIFN